MERTVYHRDNGSTVFTTNYALTTEYTPFATIGDMDSAHIHVLHHGNYEPGHIAPEPTNAQTYVGDVEFIINRECSRRIQADWEAHYLTSTHPTHNFSFTTFRMLPAPSVTNKS